MKIREEYIGIITNAAKMGAAQALRDLKPEQDLISQRKAYSEFGIAFIQDQVQRGNLTYVRKSMAAENSPKYYSRAEIMHLIASRNIETCILKLDASK